MRTPFSRPDRSGATAIEYGLIASLIGVAIVLGAAFTWYAVKLLQDPSTKTAMRVFTYSITYVTLLFGAMAVDVLVRNA